MKILYRYEGEQYCGYYEDPIGFDMQLKLRTFKVIKTTPCGVWIKLSIFREDQKFVLLGARKRYACPTKEEALESFLARQNRRKSILTQQLAETKILIEKAKEMKLKGEII